MRRSGHDAAGKALVGEVAAGAVAAGRGAVSRRAVASLGHNTQHILKDNYLSVLAAQRMRDSADAMVRAASAQAAERAVPETALREQYRENFDHEPKFQEGQYHRDWRVQNDRALARILDRLPTAVRSAHGDSASEGARDLLTQLEPTLIALERATNDTTSLNQDAMVRKSQRAHVSSVKLGGVIVGVTFAAFLIGILASSFLTNRLTRPLLVLEQAVRRLGQGDLAAPRNRRLLHSTCAYAIAAWQSRVDMECP
jgi:NtrC-family two-component system sensor histidine kinase KinB